MLQKLIEEWIKYILTPADARTVSGKPASSHAFRRHLSWTLCLLTVPFILYFRLETFLL